MSCARIGRMTILHFVTACFLLFYSPFVEREKRILYLSIEFVKRKFVFRTRVFGNQKNPKISKIRIISRITNYQPHHPNHFDHELSRIISQIYPSFLLGRSSEIEKQTNFDFAHPQFVL